MLVTIQTVEQAHSEGAGDYLKVTGIDTKTQKPTTKIVFNHYGETNLMDKWHLLQVGKTVELKMVQTYKEGKVNWNVADILLAGEQLPPAKAPEQLPEQMQAPVDEALEKVPPKPLAEPAPQAVGMITKELGDMIRAKYLMTIFGEEVGHELIRWYRSQTLGITRINYDGKNLPKFEAH